MENKPEWWDIVHDNQDEFMMFMLEFNVMMKAMRPHIAETNINMAIAVDKWQELTMYDPEIFGEVFRTYINR